MPHQCRGTAGFNPCIQEGRMSFTTESDCSIRLLKGSEGDLSKREERELRCYRMLDDLQIEYERADHPMLEAASMQICGQVDEILNVRISKNLLLCNRQETEFYLLIMPADKPFKTRELSRQVNSSRLSFAPEHYLIEYLDLHAGSVSVLGLMNDHEHHVHLLIDEDLKGQTMFACHPCVNTTSLRFPMHDLLDIILPYLGIEPEFVKLKGI